MTKNDIFDLIRQNALYYLDILEREDNDWPFPPKNILPSLSQEFQNDVEIVKSAVSANGYELKFALDHFKNYKEVVLNAVKENGCCLEYASHELRNNKEVVLVAVHENCCYRIF